jgi:flavoprotein
MMMKNEEDQQEQLPSPLSKLTVNFRYIRGFKRCKGCEIWVAAGDVVYDERKRPHCHKCNRLLKTCPSNSKARERFVEMATGHKPRRY